MSHCRCFISLQSILWVSLGCFCVSACFALCALFILCLVACCVSLQPLMLLLHLFRLIILLSGAFVSFGVRLHKSALKSSKNTQIHKHNGNSDSQTQSMMTSKYNQDKEKQNSMNLFHVVLSINCIVNIKMNKYLKYWDFENPWSKGNVRHEDVHFILKGVTGNSSNCFVSLHSGGNQSSKTTM